MLLVHVLKFQFPKPQCWKLLVIVESSVDMKYIIPRNQNLPKLQAPGGDVILAKRSFATKDVTVCFVCFVCWVTKLCSTLCYPMDCGMPAFPVLHYLPNFAQTHVQWVSDAIQPSHPLLPPSILPSIYPSIRAFSNELTLCIRWPNYWSFQFLSFQWILRVDFL